MSQFVINIVGLSILAILFWYFQIYRPAQLRKDPKDLEIKKMSASELRLADIICRHFSDNYYIVGNARFSDIFHSPSMRKNQSFNKMLLEMKSNALFIDKESGLPLLTVDLSSNQDELKSAYTTNAGVGCLIISDVGEEEAVVQAIDEALQHYKSAGA